MNKILVLQGCPASGKSTWAREFIKTHKDYVIVNRDSIRESRGEYWVPSQEDYISDIEEFEIRSAIKHNLNPIIDATNLNPKTIQKWKDIASELKCEIEFKLFEIDFKTALERDSKRERSVGKKTLISFFSRYFPDKLKEYYTDSRIGEYGSHIVGLKKDAIIVDLDGTIALHNGRNPYDLTRVLDDVPNRPLKKILLSLQKDFQIIFTSGRENICEEDTREWLDKNFNSNYILYMRNKGDYRPDEIVKEEIYKNQIEPEYFVVAVFDDRNKVCDMWRRNGLLCNQVYYGDF